MTACYLAQQERGEVGHGMESFDRNSSQRQTRVSLGCGNPSASGGDSIGSFSRTSEEKDVLL